MDETKKPSETERSQSAAAGSGGSPDETKDLSETEGSEALCVGLNESTYSDPSNIGRYRIIRRLGQGGFGRVFLAHDDDLDRPVAIKVPNPERIAHPEDVEAYLNEARILARLDHPHIVPVFDVGRTEDGLCFVVSKLVEGSDLAARIAQARPSFRDSAELVATIAEALHYAHTRGLVHRDVKPANILIDATGKPCVADFGLALKDEDFGKGGGLAGTPSYMSPEQARAEGHRVDGRSDIFSLGVVLYELLTGRRPFRGDSHVEVLEQIVGTEPRPPRQIDDTIPKELERICLKAMMKRASDRYTTARDMAEDLRLFPQIAGATVLPAAPAVPIAQPGSTPEAAPVPPTSRQSDSEQRPIKVVPKGLRSFDQQDADFYLELLPGPRDRDGLPESIRFWKRKIEQIDPDLTFKVGLIYGPSGCGKSSMVKAGLLPRLDKHVLPVYIEATPEETEARLLKGLRKACPELPRGSNLVDSLANLRRGRILPPERKVLLVLDQFEQWLHARRSDENTELIAALRHCDGEHVQAVVLVRDDFWMAATRFLSGLEIRLLEGENSAAVDLFDPRHAKKVLMAFGRAYGALPDQVGDLSRQQESFLDQSISGLAQDGKIVSVRLALFAEMMKGKPWTPATLRDVGGTQGVGLTFLEETFSASTSPPEHRFHQKSAQAVLKALLPESGTDIKGQMKSRKDLLEASGYANRPRNFDDLIRILDPELRLITPTDPEGSPNDGQQAEQSGQYFVLSHDYLVHSLRDWLTRKQRETRRGRAEIRLAEAAHSWGANRKKKSLPDFVECLSILALTRKERWSSLERQMMSAALRRHRAGTLYALVVVLMSIVLPFFGYQYIRATLLVDEYRMGVNLDSGALVRIINEMKSCRLWIDPILENKLADAQKDGDKKWILRYKIALSPSHADKLNNLYSEIFPTKSVTVYGTYYRTSQEQELATIILQKYDPMFVQRMWDVVAEKRRNTSHRYFAADILWQLDPSNPRWAEIASNIINDHDFTQDTYLSFSKVRIFHYLRTTGLSDRDTGIKERFRQALLAKVNQCRESSCPVSLLRDLFTLEEAMTLIGDRYLSGQFSLESLTERENLEHIQMMWYRQHGDRKSFDIGGLFGKESGDIAKERRRQSALLWLKDKPWLTGNRTLPSR
jgi:serine/threonine protein kinase